MLSGFFYRDPTKSTILKITHVRWSLLFLRSESTTESRFSLWLPLFKDIHYLFVCLRWVDGFSLAIPRSVLHVLQFIYGFQHLLEHSHCTCWVMSEMQDRCGESSAQWPLSASTPHTNWICAANRSCVKQECMNGSKVYLECNANPFA